MVKVRPFLACVSVLSLSLVAACGNQTIENGQATSADYAAIEARADNIFTSIGGTALQREAAHYLAVNDMNAAFVNCMDEAGYRVASVFHPIYTGWEPNSTEGLWMGELNRPLSTHALAVAASSRSEFEGDRGDAYDKAARNCGEDEPAPVVTEPEGWLDLNTKYAIALNKVDEQLGPIDEYMDCMKRAGMDYQKLSGTSTGGYQGLFLALQGMMPAAPVAGETASAEWTAYLEFEAKAMEADASCRAKKYHEGLLLLASELDALESHSGDAIDEISRQWQDVLDEGRRAGVPL